VSLGPVAEDLQGGGVDDAVREDDVSEVDVGPVCAGAAVVQDRDRRELGYDALGGRGGVQHAHAAPDGNDGLTGDCQVVARPPADLAGAPGEVSHEVDELGVHGDDDSDRRGWQ
jgi:hypothetical protein